MTMVWISPLTEEIFAYTQIRAHSFIGVATKAAPNVFMFSENM